MVSFVIYGSKTIHMIMYNSQSRDVINIVNISTSSPFVTTYTKRSDHVNIMAVIILRQSILLSQSPIYKLPTSVLRVSRKNFLFEIKLRNVKTSKTLKKHGNPKFTTI